MNKSLTSLPNIGPVLARRLEDVGITSPEDLRRVGSITALKQMRIELNEGCANTLYALEGAIRGVRWHDIPSAERKAIYRQLMSGDASSE